MSEEIPNADEPTPVLRVPESSYDDLRQIIRLSEEQFSALLRVLTKAKPQATLYRFEEQVAKEFPESEQDAVRGAVAELFRLDEVRERLGLSVEDVAIIVADAAHLSKDEDFQVTSRESVLLGKRIEQMLHGHKVLTLTSKASDLLTEHQHFFYSARLFSDMRPVFSTDAKTVEAGVVIHNLVIHYGESEDHNDFHVALDDADIQVLKDLLTRAEEKSASLQKMMRAAKVDFLPTID